MKTSLKYNLYLPSENKKIGNLEDLRNNFNIDDILDLYKTNKLQDWVTSRSVGENEEEKNEYFEIMNNINDIDFKLEDKEIILILYKIFKPTEGEVTIEETVNRVLEDRESAQKKLEIYKKVNDTFNLNKKSLLNEYLILTSKLLEKGGSEFKETMDTLKIINDDWIELFKINYTYLIYMLDRKKCNIALLGLATFESLVRIVSDAKDKQTIDIWKDIDIGNNSFYKSFIEKYFKENKVEYEKYINVIILKDKFGSETGARTIKKEGKFKILSIPKSPYSVKNIENAKLEVGSIFEKGLIILKDYEYSSEDPNDINNQIHFIEII